MKSLTANALLLITLLFTASCSLSKSDLTREKLKGKVKSLTEAEFYFYGEGNSVQEKKGIFRGKFTVLFNEKGNKTRESHYNADGSLWQTTLYQYDDKGNQVAWNSYHPDSSLFSRAVFKLDDHGNQIERKIYHPDSSLFSTALYQYDNKSNEIEGHLYGKDLNQSYVNQYDEAENKIEENIYKANGQLEWKFTYRYNEKGDELERKTYSADGKIDQIGICQYEHYDQAGNWLKQITNYNDQSVKIRERQIEYFQR